jgi:hypothetical protein
MRNENIKLVVIIIIGLLIYLAFFIETVEDVPVPKPVQKQNLALQKTDTLLNEKGYIVIGLPNEVKLISEKDTLEYKDFYKIASYRKDVIVAKHKDEDHLEVYRIKPELLSFEAHKAPVYKGKLASPDFSSNPEAKQFITRIKEGCKEGVNFAGHFTLVYWGCGTACQYGVVVDRKTGKIYNKYMSSMGSKYRKDSKLIIMESGFLEGTEKYIPLYQLKRIELKRWEGNRFEKID